MCSDRYFLLVTWLKWLMGFVVSPDEAAVDQWVGSHREHTERMAEDIWGIMCVKIGQPLSSVIVHAMTLGGTALARTSRAWHMLLRESRGRVQDRRSQLSDAVFAPTRAQNWNAVPERFRQWDRAVAE